MMNNIKTAAIVGAGALGLMYAGLLSSKLGQNCFFIADGERCDRIKNSRFSINGEAYAFPVKKPEEISGSCDLVVIAVKNNHLDAVPALIKNAVSKDTVIISVLNGIDSEEFLSAEFPDTEVVCCVALGMDAVKEGPVVTYTSPGKLLIGSAGRAGSNGITKLSRLFENCSMKYEIPDDIIRSLWWKWMINIGVNQVSAVTGACYGTFHSDEGLQQLMESAMFETVRVAEACGIDLRNDDIKDWYPILFSLGAEGKTSMLQDIEACRPTEAPWFSGKLIKLAAQHDINVPVNRTLYRIIRTKEKLYSEDKNC